jgi:hypothetical protein
MMVTGNTTLQPATTKYASTSGQLGLGATDTDTRVQVNRTLTASKLQVRVTTGGNSNTGNNNLTLLKNGVATALGVQYGTGQDGYKSDDVNSVSIADGDELSIEMVGAASGSGLIISDITLLLAVAAGGANPEIFAWAPVVRAVRGSSVKVVSSGFTPPTDPD